MLPPVVATRPDDFRVEVLYIADCWAALTCGFYRAMLQGLGGCEGFGGTVADAVDDLAAQLVAYVEADGYPHDAALTEDDLLETHVLRAALRGTLTSELAAAAGDSVLLTDTRRGRIDV